MERPVEQLQDQWDWLCVCVCVCVHVCITSITTIGSHVIIIINNTYGSEVGANSSLLRAKPEGG